MEDTFYEMLDGLEKLSQYYSPDTLLELDIHRLHKAKSAWISYQAYLGGACADTKGKEKQYKQDKDRAAGRVRICSRKERLPEKLWTSCVSDDSTYNTFLGRENNAAKNYERYSRQFESSKSVIIHLSELIKKATEEKNNTKSLT